MKNTFKILFLLFILILVLIYKDNITEYILDTYIHKKETLPVTANDYTLDYNFSYIKQTDDFFAKDKQQVLDIFYTYLNSGAREFYFYCEYEQCSKDIKELSENGTFDYINNFVSPYNNYKHRYISISSWGKVSVIVDNSYTPNEITMVNTKLKEITDKIINTNMTDKEKIKAFHNYIINNTKYDKEYISNNLNDPSNYSHRASGTLLYSKSLCGGYSHTMSLFLNQLKIPNYRISSDTHIWNLVYLDGKWYHLDLTWDDPTTSNNSDILLHDYFLIDTKKLESYNTGHHDFKNIFKEAIQTIQ